MVRSKFVHSYDILLFSLALSDLCVGIVSEPLHVGFQSVLFNNSGRITSCTLTKVRKLISVSLTTVTLLTVTAMGVDRSDLTIYLHLRYEHGSYRFEFRSKPEFFSGLCSSSITAAFAFDISIYSIATDGHQLLKSLT